MPPISSHPDTGLLLSGGLDSAILLGALLEAGDHVQPFYVRSGLVWQSAELDAVRRFTADLASPGLASLVVLDMPVADIYADHWSITGQQSPDDTTPDEAMYMPGRNPLLLLKALLWAGQNNLARVALGSLSTNPFADATEEFFEQFSSAIRLATGAEVRIDRPFEKLGKREVLLRGSHLPLEHTFSCIRPIDGLHCGTCNKCGERMAVFRAADMSDPTTYATRAAVQTNGALHRQATSL